MEHGNQEIGLKKGPYLQLPVKDGITIMWETSESVPGYVRVYQATNRQKPDRSRPCGQFSCGADRMHRVQVTGLEAGKNYCYELVSEDGTALTECFPFCTAPKEDAAIRFVLTAEYGGSSAPDGIYARPLIELMGYEHPDFLLSVGDMVNDGTQEEAWNTYIFGPFAALLRSTSFYPCIGNHEVGDKIANGRQPEIYAYYNQYFAMPHYYSFDYGCAHFCVLDAPNLCPYEDLVSYMPKLPEDYRESEQFRFLVQDLAACDKPWKFVVFHYPPYTSSYVDVPALQVLAPILEQYGVDIVFNSHAILYDRSHPIAGGKVAPVGVRYILVGGFEKFDDWFPPRLNGFSARSVGNRPGYVRVALTPYRLELQAIDYEGKLFDVLNIDKK
nr:metallophosphoesterase [uncultured Acetatifactor sp.]